MVVGRIGLRRGIIARAHARYQKVQSSCRAGGAPCEPQQSDSKGAAPSRALTQPPPFCLTPVISNALFLPARRLTPSDFKHALTRRITRRHKRMKR